MRVALLSALGDKFGEPGAGLLPFAGRSVLALQIDAALALGCERIVCLAESAGPGIAALQRQAEDASARFHAIAAHRVLSGMVSSNDELVVLAPGLLADRSWLVERFADRQGVAVLPIESGLEHGFERIDRDRAWAGALVVRGDAVEALAALPPDGDPVAGLLRIALQRGVRAIPVPEAALDDGRWSLVRGAEQAMRLETRWLSRHIPAPGLGRPGEAIGYAAARFLSTRFRTALVPFALIGSGLALALGGAAAGWSGRLVAGLLALAAGAVCSSTGYHALRFARAGQAGRFLRIWPRAGAAALDIALLGLAAGMRDTDGWHGVYAALVVIAAVRLAGEPEAPRWARPFADRATVFGLAFVGAIAAGPLVALAAIGVCGLFSRLVKPFHRG